MTRWGGAVSAAAWALALASSMGGCAEILGVTGDSDDAIKAYCKCAELTDFWPKDDRLTEFYTCEDWVRGAFSADPSTERAWLDLFETERCDQCANARACAREPPLCVPTGEACAVDESCCGFDPDIPTASYCGFFDVEGQEGVKARRCAADENPATCVPPNEACTEGGAPCCGATGGLATCSTGLGVCVAICDPDDPLLCPGCCGLVKTAGFAPDTANNVCIENIAFTDGDHCGAACSGSCEGLGIVCDFSRLYFVVEDKTYALDVAECQHATFP